jgi:thiol:disulfide interchange protein DsbC
MKRILCALVAGMLLGSALQAIAEDLDDLAAALQSVFPDIEARDIRPSAIPGLYEVRFGAELVYVSRDGRYVLQGDLLDLHERRNLSEEQREAARAILLGGVPPEEMIEFAPARIQHHVFVFTDTSCGYCRRLHRDIPELNRMGIAVSYLAFPRAGQGSAAFREMESVWCAANRQLAMTQAKSGKPVQSAPCANPVYRQFVLGQELGVRGTPAIFLDDGRALPGYLPPDELLQTLQGG